MAKPIIVGITGSSGSGKTHFLHLLSAQFTPEEVCLVSQDHYYKPIHQQPRDAQGVENFDLPESIDRVQFHADLVQLKSGHAVIKKEYTFNRPKESATTIEFNPSPIILVEGLFVHYFEEVARELDLKIFIEAKSHLSLGRRIKRDQVERGYDVHDVLYRFEYHVMPVYENLIEPLKFQSDFIIPNHSKMDVAVDVIATYLRKKMKDSVV